MVFRVGVKASTSALLSTEHQEFIMSQQEKNSPLILQTLVNHQTTPEQHEGNSPHRYRCHSFTCCQLVFTSSGDESLVRPQSSSADASCPAFRSAALSPSEHHNQYHYCIYTQNTEQFYTDFNNVAWDNDTPSTEDHFPTAPLDDEVWSEDPIPDRLLCIHERPHEPNLKCSYPCPYGTTTFRMDLPQSTPQGAAVLNYK